MERLSEPCRCQACTVAGVTCPPITIPGYRNIPAKELHGVELLEHVAAQDRLRATIDNVRKRSAEVKQNEAEKPTEAPREASEQ